MNTNIRRLAPAASVLGLVIGFGGCAGPPPPQVSPAVTRHFKGLPQGMSIPKDRRDGSKPWAAWAGQRTIYVMTWGSGSCPRLPTTVKAIDADQVTIHTEEIFYRKDAVCTADLAVTTSVVRLPSTVTAAHRLLVRIDRSTTHLPARQR